MSCKEFKEKVQELKAQGKTITQIANELGRHRASVSRHFSESKRSWARDNRLKNKFEIDKYKVNKGCYLCSESDPRVLQFHHVNSEDKESTISKMLSAGRSLEKILKEIEKCEVVCANCHLKIHNEL